MPEVVAARLKCPRRLPHASPLVAGRPAWPYLCSQNQPANCSCVRCAAFLRPLSGPRQDMRAAAENYHVKKRRAPGAEASSSRAPGIPGCLCRSAPIGKMGTVKEMTQKGAVGMGFASCQGDKFHGVELRFARRRSRRVVDTTPRPHASLQQVRAFQNADLGGVANERKACRAIS